VVKESQVFFRFFEESKSQDFFVFFEESRSQDFFVFFEESLPEGQAESVPDSEHRSISCFWLF
jgi:hypothetical protein